MCYSDEGLSEYMALMRIYMALLQIMALMQIYIALLSSKNASVCAFTMMGSLYIWLLCGLYMALLRQ